MQHYCKKVLRNKRHIHCSAILLLLIYICSNSPAFMFHHHIRPIVAYDKAGSCEKVIYYTGNDGCNHKSHISTAFERCSLCDHHNLNAHINFLPVFAFINFIDADGYSTGLEHFVSAFAAEAANRGPPEV